MNGPLTGGGTFDAEPYTGKSRFPYAHVWPVRKPEKGLLPDGLGLRAVYQHKHGHFTTVSRVVAASPGGLPKVIISYALEALPKDKRMEPEPWKAEELRNLMRLSRLRVGVLARQLVTFGFSSAKDDLPEAPEENSYFPQYVPTRLKCATPSFTVTWVKKVTALRPVPSRIWADPPPLSTGLLWNAREHDLIDPYRVASELFGSDAIPDHNSPEWLRTCSARGRKCSLCPQVEASRLVPCCACENWVHLECSYGIPEGRLCAAHCQIIDPLKGVVVTDFNCPKGDLRCLVPWRPWAKKMKVQWETKRGSGLWGWDREFFEMIPNWALEKHAWLGAGLIWKRVHASSPIDRLKVEDPNRQGRGRPRVVPTTEEKKASGPLPPWKALPLILPWDDTYRETYHADFEPSKAHPDLAWRCPMTSLFYANYSNLDVMHGFEGQDRPWMLSPPQVPIEGATTRDPEETRVMVYHGLTYSHSGLTDPAVMPGYVAVAKWKHEMSLAWTTLNPSLPEWSEVAGWYDNRNWDVGLDMQAFARPDGAERAMAYNADARGWVPRPKEPQPAPEKKKSKAAAKAKTKEEKKGDSSRKKRRRPDATEPGEKDENREVVNVKPKDSDSDAKQDDDQGEVSPHPQAEDDEPHVADKQERTKEKTKGVVLKKADDPAVKEKAEAVLGEKAPHPPVGTKASEEASVEEAVDDPYAKAPHGDTDEEDLEAELRSLGGLPRRSSEVRSDRSDRAAYDEEERRSVPSSSLAKKEEEEEEV